MHQAGLYRDADVVATETRRQLEAIPGVRIKRNGDDLIASFDESARKAVTAVIGTRAIEAATFPGDEIPEDALFGPAMAPHAQPFLDRLAALDVHGMLMPSAAAFVRDELGLRWGWLAYELIDSFSRDLYARAFGVEIVRSFTVEAQSPPVPSIEFTFRTAERERVDAARQRLLDHVKDVLGTLDQAERAAHGRRPRQDSDYLQRNAGWFYRAKVKQPSDHIRSLAREYQAAREAVGEHVSADSVLSNVRKGIRDAERLLSGDAAEN